MYSDTLDTFFTSQIVHSNVGVPKKFAEVNNQLTFSLGANVK